MTSSLSHRKGERTLSFVAVISILPTVHRVSSDGGRLSADVTAVSSVLDSGCHGGAVGEAGGEVSTGRG